MQDKGYTVVSNTREKPSDSPDKFIRLSPDLLDELAVAQVAKEIADALGVRSRTFYSTATAGVIGIFRTWAMELAPRMSVGSGVCAFRFTPDDQVLPGSWIFQT